MCGRFTLRTPADELSELFSATLRDGLLLSPRYNIAPSQLVACVRQPPEGQRELVTLRWGLVPSWAKDAKIGYSLINARSETVANKPAFRSPFRRRRCLIPADGFFEWQAVPGSKTKQPHYITLQGGQPFAFAGLWERWIGPDGNPLESCSIITTEPNELMKTIHNRMPVILPPDLYSVWFDPEIPGEQLQSLLIPFPASKMLAQTISAYVGNVRNEGPRCIEPLAA